MQKIFKNEKEIQQEQNKTDAWKRQTYILGTFLGSALGFLSAYMFTREAADTLEAEDTPEIPPTVLLGIALSILSLIRQIAETGRKKK